MSAVRTESLVLGYRGKPLCEKLDFAVEPGEVVALFGENGVGKSTLLKTLVGALPPVSGSVFYGDANGAALKPGERAKRVSMVFARSLISMSIRRLYELSSNCSRDFLFTKVERLTVKIFLLVGRGMGPFTTAPVIFTVFTIFSADLSTKL